MFLDVCLTGRPPYPVPLSHAWARGASCPWPALRGLCGEAAGSAHVPGDLCRGEQAEQAPSATVASAPMSGLPWAVVPRSYV